MEMSEEYAYYLSDKSLAFIKDVEEVCKKHGLGISTSMYDGFEVWPLREGHPCLYGAGIEDMAGNDA